MKRISVLLKLQIHCVDYLAFITADTVEDAVTPTFNWEANVKSWGDLLSTTQSAALQGAGTSPPGAITTGALYSSHVLGIVFRLQALQGEGLGHSDYGN